MQPTRLCSSFVNSCLTSPDVTAFGVTRPAFVAVVDANDTIAILRKGTMAFKTQPTGAVWDYNHEVAVGNSYNFENTVLHELGHLFTLKHCQEQTLMYYGNSIGTDPVGNIMSLNADPALIGGQHVMWLSSQPNNTANIPPMVLLTPANCALDTCSTSQTNCTDPAYPLYAYFTVLPSMCVNNPTAVLNSNWQSQVSEYLELQFQNVSLGNIPENGYEWIITGNYTAYNCANQALSNDTCALISWYLPTGITQTVSVTLKVTDSGGCTSSYTQTFTIQPLNSCSINLSAPLQILPPTNNCNNVGNCQTGQNGAIHIPPIATGSGCYLYNAYYSQTDPNVTNQDAAYNDSDFVKQNDQSATLSCLPEGYYKLYVSDAVSTCLWDTIIYLLPATNFNPPLVDIITTRSIKNCAEGYDYCNGQIEITAIGGLTIDTTRYDFAWSSCELPSNCNSPILGGLCSGLHTLTITDTWSGCAWEQNVNVPFIVGTIDENGVVTGIKIDVYPTVYESNVNLKIAIPEDGEVTIEVYNIYGVMIKKVLDNEYKTAGEHTLQDNSLGLPDGLYFYVLKYCEGQKTDYGIKQ